MRAALLMMLTATNSWATPLTTLGEGSGPQDDVADGLVVDGGDDASGHVWNGSVVPNTNLRAVVSLFVGARTGNGWQGGVFCSGTLVHPEWVVTAAHCLSGAEDQAGGGFSLYVGVGSEWPYDRQIAWDSYVMHPDYNENGQAGAGYDIGLVKLATPIYDEPLMPVNGEPMDESWIGLELTLAGYGITRDNRNDAGTKRRTTLPFINFDGDLLIAFNGSVYWSPRDQAYYPSTYNSTSNVCQGDSGGATLAPAQDGGFVLVGVNAIVTPGCQNGAAGSTRTDAYIDWIDGYVPLDEVQQPGGTGPVGPEYLLEPFAPGELEPLDYGAPLTPEAAQAYPEVSACDQAGRATLPTWMALLGLLGLRRRRR